MVDWQPVTHSERIVAEAYDEERERILVRFPDGVEWYYENCPPYVWEEFTAAGQSRGEYINEVLDNKPHAQYLG